MTTKPISPALFWLKLFHTVVFLAVSAAILYILYSGIANQGGPLLVVSVAAVLAESAVYVLNGTRCPLTNLAKQMGDHTGNDWIADIFLPEQFARRIPQVCGALAVIGIVIVGLRIALG
ncbi:MAG: hypothetical protein IPM16_20960 [Chloroflexi bacterium]|nr:hypothetical protein [Chloroflexota bacterium]